MLDFEKSLVGMRFFSNFLFHYDYKSGNKVLLAAPYVALLHSYTLFQTKYAI